MFSEVEYTGDAGYIAEDLLADDRELERRCQAVEKSTEEGYFSIDIALSIYQVTELQFLAYHLLKKAHLQAADKQQQLIESLNMIVQLYQPSINQFDNHGRKIIEELQVLSH
jgi:hypothetical protein